MFGYSTELRSCTEVTFIWIKLCNDRMISAFFLLSICFLRQEEGLKVLLESVLISISSGTLFSGKGGVHHGIQQVSALPASHAGGTHPQVFGSYGSAARKEEQVEELRSFTIPSPFYVVNWINLWSCYGSSILTFIIAHLKYIYYLNFITIWPFGVSAKLRPVWKAQIYLSLSFCTMYRSEIMIATKTHILEAFFSVNSTVRQPVESLAKPILTSPDTCVFSALPRRLSGCDGPSAASVGVVVVTLLSPVTPLITTRAKMILRLIVMCFKTPMSVK